MIQDGQYMAGFLLIGFIILNGVVSQNGGSAPYTPNHWSGVEQGRNGELTQAQKQILENGATRVHQNGVRENIQPLRAGGEDPLRLRLVFMAEVNSTDGSKRRAQEMTHTQQKDTGYKSSSSGNLHLSVGSRPYGQVVHLPEKGIIIAREVKDPPPPLPAESNRRMGRLSIFRNLGPGGPSGQAQPERARRPVSNIRAQEALRDKTGRYRPSVFARRFPPKRKPTALEVLTGNAEAQTAPKPPWDGNRQSGTGSDVNTGRQRYSDTGDPYSQSDGSASRAGNNFDYGTQQNVAGAPYTTGQGPDHGQPTDNSYAQYQQNPPTEHGHETSRFNRPRESHVQSNVEYYPARRDPQGTSSNRQAANEVGQVHRLGSILSDMGQSAHSPYQTDRYIPSTPADSRPYPIQYTIPDTNQMRVRRIQQQFVEQPRYVENGVEQVRLAPVPADTSQRYQPTDNRQVSRTVPDNYSEKVRSGSSPQSTRNSYSSPQTISSQTAEVTSNEPRIPENRSTGSHGSGGTQATDPNGNLVLISMQENADGTMTYTVADPRKVNVDQINNKPVPVRKPKPRPVVQPVYDSTHVTHNGVSVQGSADPGYPYSQHQSYSQMDLYHQGHHAQQPSESVYQTQDMRTPGEVRSIPYSQAQSQYQNDQAYAYEPTRHVSYEPARPSEHYSSATHARPQQSQPYDSQGFSPHQQPPTEQYVPETRMNQFQQHNPNTVGSSNAYYSNQGASDPSQHVQTHTPYHQEPTTYVESVTSPPPHNPQMTVSINNGPVSQSTSDQHTVQGNYTIDDGVIYRQPNKSISGQIRTKTLTKNPFIRTIQNSSLSSWNHQKNQQQSQNTNFNSQSRVISDSAGRYSFRNGNLQEQSANNDLPRNANGAQNQQPRSVTFPVTTQSPLARPTNSRPRSSSVDVLKDIVNLSRNRNGSRSSVTHHTRRLQAGSRTQTHPIVEAASDLQKIKVLKSSECIPMTFSNNGCRNACLPYQHCIKGGSILFCCPPLVTEEVVQYRMMQRTVEGMSDTF